jgi:ankyrin repeat protein
MDIYAQRPILHQYSMEVESDNESTADTESDGLSDDDGVYATEPSSSRSERLFAAVGTPDANIDPYQQLRPIVFTDLNFRNGNGDSLLHVAAANTAGSFYYIDNLLKVPNRPAGCLDAKNNAGGTALMAAAAAGAMPAVRGLLAAGARTTIKDNSNATALWKAAETGSSIAVLALLKHEELMPPTMRSTESKTTDGMTPLAIAAKNGQFHAVQALLRGGADAGATDLTGRTPEQLAHLSGVTEVIQLFVGPGLARHQRVPGRSGGLVVAAAAGGGRRA